ncbi:hypothetical protein [Microcystis phage Mel-JY01]
MSNFEYKNIDQILSTNLPIRGTRLDLEQDKKIIVPRFEPFVPSDTYDGVESIEVHAFLPNTAYIGSTYNVNTWKIEELNGKKNISLDIHRDINQTGLNLPPGTYKVVYNFFRNIIGSFSSNTKLFVSEISTDRRELKLSLASKDDAIGKQQLSEFVLNYLRPGKYLKPIVLNFGENKICDIINVTSDGSTNSFYVKLYDQLPIDVDLYFTCWVQLQIMKPFIETVVLIADAIDNSVNYISGPNFEIEYDYWKNSETKYKSFSELLGDNDRAAQEILNKYISGSVRSVNLNIDYREFNNFVFYSSAFDRIQNFYYKIQNIQEYNTQLDILDSVTGSVSANKINIKNLRETVISSFDNFEKWLYFETTGSSLYTYQQTASINPYPKIELSATASSYDISTKYGKYNLYPINSPQVRVWVNELLQKAEEFDDKNYSSLVKAIPAHIREDEQNSQFVTFINMIGQFYDTIYLYSGHITKKNLREEHPYDGISQDLIYESARNLGWTMSHGTQVSELSNYTVGVSGSNNTPNWYGKVHVDKYLSRTPEERTKEVWRRVYNNLPYIFKTKGTARSVYAILAAYGIPKTLLTIREFGGPDNADLGIIPKSEWEKQTYYLNFRGSYSIPFENNYVEIPWEQVKYGDNWQYPNTVTFRWKMEPNKFYSYQGDFRQTILQKESSGSVDWFVSIEKQAIDSEIGNIIFHYNNGSGSYITSSVISDYFYDDIPINLMIRKRYFSGSYEENYIDVFVKTSKYGKVVINKVSTLTDISHSIDMEYWNTDGVLYVGSGSNYYTDNILSGSIFELRYWSNELQESSFDNHVCAPRSYNSNTSTGSFYDLQAQFQFWKPFDASATSSVISVHPDQKNNLFLTSSKIANLNGFDLNSFESIVENYTMEVATVGSNTPFSEKVRIDSSSIIGNLDANRSVEISRFDKFTNDTNRLVIGFSPQSIINEDIYEAIGNANIDDFIGNYSSTELDNYPELKWFAREYWKKYPNKNDFTAYIRLFSSFDFSVFDQIRQTLPARVNDIMGIIVEPNVLERSRVKSVNRVSSTDVENSVLNSTEIVTNAVPSGSISSYASTIRIGFETDEDSEFTDFYGERDVSPETDGVYVKINDSDTDISIGTFFNISSNVSSSISLREITAPSVLFNRVESKIQNTPTEILSSYNSINTEILDNLKSTISSTYNQQITNLSVTDKSSIVGSITSENSCNIDTQFIVSYVKNNSVFVNGSWVNQQNLSDKSQVLSIKILNSRIDGYYKNKDMIFSSDTDAAALKYASYTLKNSGVQNSNNKTTSIRNHQFLGCKITSPDILIGDGVSVVQIFNTDPNTYRIDERFSGNAG